MLASRPHARPSSDIWNRLSLAEHCFAVLLFHALYQNSTRPRQNWTWAQQRNCTYHEAVGAMNERLIAVAVDWPHHGLIVSAWYRHTMSAQEAISFAHGTCTRNKFENNTKWRRDCFTIIQKLFANLSNLK